PLRSNGSWAAEHPSIPGCGGYPSRDRFRIGAEGNVEMSRGLAIKVGVAAVVVGAVAVGAWAVLKGDDTHPSAAGREVVVGFYESPPKLFLGPNGERRGLFVDVLEGVAAEEGWSLTYVD